MHLRVDANGDGFDDLIYVARDGTDYNVYVGDNADSLQTFYTFNTLFDAYNEGGVFKIIALDLDSDGREELVYTVDATWNNNKYWRYYDFEDNDTYPLDFVVENINTSWVDINSDGAPDMVYQEDGVGASSSIIFRLNEFHNGGTFSNEITVPVNMSVPSTYDDGYYDTNYVLDGDPTFFISDALPASDFNIDGRADIWGKVNVQYLDTNNGLSLSVTYLNVFQLLYENSAYSYEDLIDYSDAIELTLADDLSDARIGDFNGDGLTDLLFYRDNTAENWWDLYLSSGSELKRIDHNTLVSPTGDAVSINDIANMVVTDINYDGLSDVLYEVSSNWSNQTFWYYHLSNGEGFTDRIAHGSSSYDDPDRYFTVFGNFDGDRNLDIAVADSHDKKIHILTRVGSAQNGNLLSEIETGQNLKTSIVYSSLTDGGVYFKGRGAELLNYGAASPIFDYIGPMTVVSSVESSAPGYVGGIYDPDHTLGVEYHYEGLRFQAGGRGSLGFAKLSTYDPQTNVTVETVYRQDFPFIGMPLATLSFMGEDLINGLDFDGNHNIVSDAILSFSQNTYDSFTLFDGQIFLPYLQSSEEHHYVLNDSGDIATRTSTTITSNTYNTYADNHINLQTSVVEVQDSNGSVVSRITTDNQYEQDFGGNETSIDDWWIGRITRSSVAHYFRDAFPNKNSTITRTSEFTYHSSGTYKGMLKFERIQPEGAQSERMTTLHCYDENSSSTYGNEDITITYSGTVDYGCQSTFGDDPGILEVPDPEAFFRRVVKEYDADGIYSVNTGNDQFTTAIVAQDGRDKFGNITDVTDVNGVRTIYAFDGFGAVFAQAKETGQASTIFRRLAGNLWVDAPAVTEPFAYAEKTSSLTGPTIYKYFDSMGREVATVKEGFDEGDSAGQEQWIHQYTSYDVYGRVINQSIPKLVTGKTGATFNWVSEATSNEYDYLGRIQESVSPENTVNTVFYDGLRTTTTTTFEDPTDGTHEQIRSETIDILGRVVNVTQGDMQVSDEFTSLIYKYDSTGNLTLVEDQDRVGIVNEFDDLGRKTRTIDPDKGVWEYSYNALGELISQKDGNQVTTTFTRDSVGRTTFKEISGGDDTYYEYDRQHLEFECVFGDNDCDYNKPIVSYYFDAFGRLESTLTTFEGLHFSESKTYDEFGRVFQVFDASGNFNGVRNIYSGAGYLYKQVEARTSASDTPQVFREVLSMDAWGNVTKVLQNEGKIVSTKQHDPITGLVSRILTEDVYGRLIQDSEFTFDGIGNLQKRVRNTLLASNNQNNRQTEDFDYDGLNRLTSVNGVERVQYHANGNIKKKDGDYYCYAGTKPHAVSGIGTSSSRTSTEYSYDNNGNTLIGRNVTRFEYTKYNKVSSIDNQQNGVTTFEYNTNHNRIKRTTTTPDETIEIYYAGGVEFVYKNGSYSEVRRYIPGGVSTTFTNGNSTTNYFHYDHLGSIDSVTNEDGLLSEKLYFDPWGRKYRVDKESMTQEVRGFALETLVDLSELTFRGFTGHEHVDHLSSEEGAGIIHMNGRIYDPTLGRFLQADPFIQAPLNSQNYNRYSYVLNNPLSYTDPSGYNFVKKFGRKLIRGAAKIFGAELVNLVGSFVAGYFGGPWGAAAWQYEFTRAMGGSSSGALRGAFTAYVTAGLSGYSTGNAFGDFLVRGAIGGASSYLNGGNFGHGFWSAGLSHAAGGTNATSNPYANVVFSAAIGGTISKVTGGKFANGVYSAAFSAALAQDWGSSNGKGRGGSGSAGTCSANPINLATGEKYLTMRDYQASGASRLVFERYYSSYAREKTSLGNGWRHNFDRKLRFEDETAFGTARFVEYKTKANKSVHFAAKVNDFRSYENVSDSAEHLNKIQEGWQLTLADGTVELFDEEGRLVQVDEIGQYKQTLTYNENGRLVSVIDSAGQQLIFDYDRFGLMTSVETADGVTNYEYNRASKVLTKVLTPENSNGERGYKEYHYDDKRFRTAITSITNELGDTIHHMAYDDNGRAIMSALGDDAERVDVAFLDNNTSLITSALGRETTYHFDSNDNPVSIEGHSTASCIASNQGYEYDERGNMVSKTDWNGVVTTYTYNDRNLETNRTEAVGTPLERRVTTTWHSDFAVVTSITTESNNQVFEY